MRRRGDVRPTEEQQHRLLTTGGALAALSKHPSWPDLVETIEEKKRKLERVQIAKVLTSGMPANQRDIDFVRGFIAGMEYLLSIPSTAEGRLEAYLKKHGVNLEEGAAR
jgi:hypothetical protein